MRSPGTDRIREYPELNSAPATREQTGCSRFIQNRADAHCKSVQNDRKRGESRRHRTRP
jgi:hypothetical protein